jgi:hypothetical protein
VTRAFLHYACSIDAGEDALRSEDVGFDGFSRLDAQKELLLGPVRSTLEQHQCNNLDSLLLYTLREETYHKANVAIIVTARGRASVVVPPTCSAIEFYSCLRDLSTTGGETNFAGALGLASLLARRAVSPRIIGFIAGDLNSSSVSPFSISTTKAKSLAATLTSRVDSLPFKGSELTLISFASPLELGTETVSVLESSLGKEKIRWVHADGKKENNFCGGGGGGGLDDTLTQFLMDLKLCIEDEADIPSFIASKTTPEPEFTEEPAPSVINTPPLPVTAGKIHCHKSGLLHRSSFSCRDSCLDVLLHHSRSGLLRSKLPTYSTLAYKASQDQSANSGGASNNGGSNPVLLAPQACYIRIMPQPKYRTLLTLQGALMLSRAGFETAPLHIATRLATVTATTTRQLVQPTQTNAKNSPFLGRGRSRPSKLGRGPLGVVKILQNINHPEVLLLTWMPVCGTHSGGIGNADVHGSSSAAVDTSTYPIPEPEPFDMFSGRPPVTLASILQTLSGGDSKSTHARGGGIESALQNPFEHDGWEYWAQGQPHSPFHFTAVLTQPAAATTAAAGSPSNLSTSASYTDPGNNSGGGVTVVEKTLEIVGTGNNNNNNTGGAGNLVYEKGYALLFNTPPISTSSAASSSNFDWGSDIVGGACVGITSSGNIPPLWIPTGTGLTDAPAEEHFQKRKEEEEENGSAPCTPFERKLNNASKKDLDLGSSILLVTEKRDSTTAVHFISSMFISILSNTVFISTCVVFFTLQIVHALLRMFWKHGKHASKMAPTGSHQDLRTLHKCCASRLHVVKTEERVKHAVVQTVREKTSPPPRHIPSIFSSSLKYPLSQDSLVQLLKTRHRLENELSSLMTSPPWVSITDVVQSIRDAVTSNNCTTTGSTTSTIGIGTSKAARSSPTMSGGRHGATTSTTTTTTTMNKENTSASHPASIILGPLDPAALSYLMKQQQQQQVGSHIRSTDGKFQSAVEDYRDVASLQQQQQQKQQMMVAASGTTTQTIKARFQIDVARAMVTTDSTLIRGNSNPIKSASTSTNSMDIDIPLRRECKRARQITITTGSSSADSASGRVAVMVNGRQLPVSASPSTACMQNIAATAGRVLPGEGSLPIPIPCSNTFVKQEGEAEEEVKMPLTPPGAVTVSVVTGARASGLEGSAPPPNPDTAE